MPRPEEASRVYAHQMDSGGRNSEERWSLWHPTLGHFEHAPNLGEAKRKVERVRAEMRETSRWDEQLSPKKKVVS